MGESSQEVSSKPGATKKEEVQEKAEAPDQLNPTGPRDPLAGHMISMQDETNSRTSQILASYRSTARRRGTSNRPG